MDSSSSALRPLTLRSLPPQLAEISSLRARLAQSEIALERYTQLDSKLGTFTDEPVWNAWIPFGPLAYFPGQLVHTNDVLVPPTAALETGTAAAHPEPEPHQQPTSSLRSAKQARQDAQTFAKALETEVAALKREIAQKEEQLSQQRRQEHSQAASSKGKGKAPLDLDLVAGELGQEDWTINERGEVINEEGLPMFDIHEDLPPDDSVSTSDDKSVGGSESGQTQPPTRRYLIKKGGKQTLGTLNPNSAPPPVSRSPLPPARAAEGGPARPLLTTATNGENARGDGNEDKEEKEEEADAHAHAHANPIPDRPRLDIKAILDELEAEERLQLQKEKEQEEEEEEAAAPVPSSAAASAPAPAPPSPAVTATHPAAASDSANKTGFAGFTPGFLTKSSSSSSSKQKRPSNSLTTTTAPSTGSVPVPATTTTSPTPTAVPTSSPASASSSFPPPKDKSTSPPPSLTTTKGKVPAAARAAAPVLKPALSRPVSPSRAAGGRGSGASTPVEKKRVAFDLPPPSASASSAAAAPKRKPIILGMGDATPEFETISSDEFKNASSSSSSQGSATAVVEKGKGKGSVDAEEKEVAASQSFQRPIRDTVVEKPLRKPVPPPATTGSLSSSSSAAGGAGAGAPVREKRVSRFKRMKEDALGDVAPATGAGNTTTSAGTATAPPPPPSVSKRPQPEWEGPPEVVPTASKPLTDDQSRRAADSEEAPAKKATVPAPVHTISFGAPKAEQPVPEGTVSYADSPDDSNDDEDDEEPYDVDDSEEDEFVYSDDDDEEDIDDAELDVDAALHAREVALAYHQQRLNLGGGRGTGALGGYHEVGQSPFGNIGRDNEAIVPADATLQSLDPELANNAFGSYSHAGSAQLGKGSRFRNATRHLESAQLIIPSLLAADPTFTTSKEALGPASSGPIDHQVEDDDGLDETERERLRKTLEAIAEGRPLPEDQQQYERQREIFLREELAQEKEERERERRARERTAGKKPPELVQRIPPPPPPAAAAQSPPAAAPSVAPISNSVVEKAPSTLLASDKMPSATATAPDAAATEAEPPKRMSRFRQKQLGLID